MAASSIQSTLLTIFTLLLTVAVDPVAAYYYAYSSWYIYVVVVFIVIAISSCIGACVRYKRNQMILEQQRIIVAQRGAVNVTTAGAVNGGYYPSTYPTGAYPPPQGGFVQNPPAYHTDGAQPEKDPNMPPAYEDALRAPSADAGNQAPYPPPAANQAPYSPPAANQAPYPTSGNPPYPTQSTPYPTPPAP